MPEPDAPEDLSELETGRWHEFWTSPQASHVTVALIPALMRLFELRSLRERFLEVGLVEPVTEGSTGQLVVHPLIKQADVLTTQILALEDRFGLSSKASTALAGEFDDATNAAARANEALSAGFGPPNRQKQQRRLAAVE